MPEAGFTRADLYRSGPSFPSRLKIKLTVVLHCKVNIFGPAYFCHLGESLPAGEELVEPFSAQDLPHALLA